MGDNFLPCARDQRSLLPEGSLAWFILDAVAQRGAQRMNFWCPTGSIIDLRNRLGDAFNPYRTRPSLTRRCQMGDNYQRDDLFPYQEATNCNIVTPTLRMDYRFSDSCIV